MFYIESQWGPILLGHQKIFVCVFHKKESQTGLEYHDGE